MRLNTIDLSFYKCEKVTLTKRPREWQEKTLVITRIPNWQKLWKGERRGRTEKNGKENETRKRLAATPNA